MEFGIFHTQTWQIQLILASSYNFFISCFNVPSKKSLWFFSIQNLFRVYYHSQISLRTIPISFHLAILILKMWIFKVQAWYSWFSQICEIHASESGLLLATTAISPLSMNANILFRIQGSMSFARVATFKRKVRFFQHDIRSEY